MNCHRGIWPADTPDHQKLGPLRDSFGNGDPAKKGLPIEWKMVTTVPDYVYFNHSAHVNSGVSCVECHGQVNQMEIVYQAKPMNMAWCLQCHRDPTEYIRPRDQVTNLDWKPGAEDKSTLAVLEGLEPQELTSRLSGLNARPTSVQSSDKAWMASQYAKLLSEKGTLKRELGAILMKQYNVNPNTDCITCHR